MSLPVLGAMVVLGIALIVFAIHLSGGSLAAVLDSEDRARARFAEDFPAETVREVVITADRLAAFLDLGRGRFGLVQSIGGHFLTRLLATADVVSATRVGNKAVALRLGDFTFGGGIYAFGDAVQTGRVAAMLAGESATMETI